MSAEPGQMLSHYRLIEKIGEGGMGVVYRARDERLDRDVAIKVLPEAVSRDHGRLARFEREAKAVAKLSHPNILEIFDFGTESEITYAVTELLEGETLGKRLERGPLGWRKAAETGAAIAEGLAAAHRSGIVHRDLKPSNVFLTADGRVKILDFGLARTVEVPGAGDTRSPTVSDYTAPGAVLGTVGYMSPEQVRGERADQRSDIFSLGCVLYEMITGTRAFVRDTAAETMAAILREASPDVHPRSPDVPPGLRSAVGRCLEKQPGARFQSGQDLAFALRSFVESGSRFPTHETPREKSILVLPFTNLSPDAEQEYFSDGLTEEIIADLAKVRTLRVISRTSAMRLKGTDKSIETISRELNTRYVLEGSVRKVGSDLRITAQLIDAPNDTHLWSEKYRGNLDDFFDIQEKVSRSIVDALELKLNPEESSRIAERPIDNIRAYECYLRARREMHTFTEHGLHRALRELQNGLEIVGENALLYFGLGEVYLYYLEFGIESDDATLKKARECAGTVLELDPDSSRSHYLLGMIERLRGNILDGIRHLERAFGIDPDSPNNLGFLSLDYAWVAGRVHPGMQLAKRLAEIDPLTPTTYLVEGLVHWVAGRLDLALSFLEKHASMEPECIHPRFWRVYVLLWKDQPQQAIDLIDQITEQESSDGIHKIFSEFLLFSRHVFVGDRQSALNALSDDARDYFWTDPELPWLGAGIHSLMGDKDGALRWLEHAIDRGWINYPLFAERDPFLENIRGEERFRKLMARIKPEWERFQVRADLSGMPPASEGE